MNLKMSPCHEVRYAEDIYRMSEKYFDVIARAKLILQNRKMSVTLCKHVIGLALKLTKRRTCKSVAIFMGQPVNLPHNAIQKDNTVKAPLDNIVKPPWYRWTQ